MSEDIKFVKRILKLSFNDMIKIFNKLIKEIESGKNLSDRRFTAILTWLNIGCSLLFFDEEDIVKQEAMFLYQVYDSDDFNDDDKSSN